jgi:hypothetical protein
MSDYFVPDEQPSDIPTLSPAPKKKTNVWLIVGITDSGAVLLPSRFYWSGMDLRRPGDERTRRLLNPNEKAPSRELFSLGFLQKSVFKSRRRGRRL